MRSELTISERNVINELAKAIFNELVERVSNAHYAVDTRFCYYPKSNQYGKSIEVQIHPDDDTPAFVYVHPVEFSAVDLCERLDQYLDDYYPITYPITNL